MSNSSDGSVIFYGSNLTNEQLRVISGRFLKGQNPSYLLDLVVISIEVTAPIFLFESLGRLCQVGDLSFPSHSFLEVTATDIRSGDFEQDISMAEHIRSTIINLNANSLALSTDGCDRFTSYMTTPISNLRTKLLTGTIREFSSFTSNKQAPLIIKRYQDRIRDILSAEFSDLSGVFKNG